jgi:hypothetical protein
MALHCPSELGSAPTIEGARNLLSRARIRPLLVWKVPNPAKSRSGTEAFQEGDDVAVICCASCGYRRRAHSTGSQYGRPAKACPDCGQSTYWTDWLDPRGFMRVFWRRTDPRFLRTP